MTETLLSVRDVTMHFPVSGGLFSRRRRVARALDGVSLDAARGETLSVVGESGCGKSTLGRIMMGLATPTSGTVTFRGERLDLIGHEHLRRLRRHMQVVFQDPYSSLNPRMTVAEIISEPIRNFALSPSPDDLRRRMAALVDRVRLPRDALRRYPHEFSGGQRQRIAIARALATAPDMIVCDEAVSALDVSVKAQIVNLLKDLQADLGLTLVFISHDLGIVEHISHRLAVMYLGQVVETGSVVEIYRDPRHPYTQALLSSVPVAKPGLKSARILLKGDLPSNTDIPKGCRFQSRCPQVAARCRLEEPALVFREGREVACHLAGEPGSAGDRPGGRSPAEIDNPTDQDLASGKTQ